MLNPRTLLSIKKPFVTLLGASLMMGCSLCNVSPAATHALIIGIDKYTVEDPLLGAVNDANHIEGALLRSGIPRQNITTLVKTPVTRQQVKQAWNNMVSRSKPGDHLVLTFSGHGTQTKDGNGDERKRDAADQYDETYLLTRYNRNHPQLRKEMLLDDELGGWFDKAIKQKRNVLFLADACNSGGGYRNISGEVGKARYVAPINTTMDVLQDGIVSSDDLEQNQRFAFFSGSQASQVVREVERPRPFGQKGGEMRGALSYAFAEAIYEKLRLVDKNRDNALSIDELKAHITEAARSYSDKNQEPTFYPTRGANPVLRIKPRTIPRVPPARKQHVAIKVEGQRPSYLNHLSHIRAVNRNYDLLWDTRNKKVFNKQGDLVAKHIASQDSISKVASRFQLRKIIQKLAQGHTIESKLGNTQDKTHRKGQQVSFSISGMKHKTLIQFNLAGNGTVQCFPKAPVNRSKGYNFKTSDPVGNDTLVSLVMDNPPKRLLQLVGNTNQCTQDIDTLVNELPRLLRGKRYQLAHIDTFVTE